MKKADLDTADAKSISNLLVISKLLELVISKTPVKYLKDNDLLQTFCLQGQPFNKEKPFNG